MHLDGWRGVGGARLGSGWVKEHEWETAAANLIYLDVPTVWAIQLRGCLLLQQCQRAPTAWQGDLHSGEGGSTLSGGAVL